MDDLTRIDGERVKRLRKDNGWTQARLALEIGSVGIGWVRKLEGGRPVRLEWTSNTGVVYAGEDLASALDVELDTLILDLLDGDKVRQLREQRDWAPEHLADKAQLAVYVVTRAETGQYVHRSETHVLAEIFDVPASDLLLRTGVKHADLGAEDSAKYLRAAVVGLCMIGRKRAARMKYAPDDAELLEEAHGRIQFTLWKMGREAGGQLLPVRTNTPYALAIETAIGSEFAYHNCLPSTPDIVARAKGIAAGQDEGMISSFSTCENLTAQYLSCWADRTDLDVQWEAPAADLRKLCTAGLGGLAMAINATRYNASENYTQASTEEACARLDFLTAFVSRYHQHFSGRWGAGNAEVMRLLMLFVLGSQIAAFRGQRLSFPDTVEIEQTAQELLSWVLCNTSTPSA